MSDLNAAGWHFHFISSDKKAWGHILNLDIKSANAIIDETEKFNLYIPNWEFFNWLNLTADQNAAIKEVEQGQKKEE
jgi:acetolactate decarboxylase